MVHVGPIMGEPRNNQLQMLQIGIEAELSEIPVKVDYLFSNFRLW